MIRWVEAWTWGFTRRYTLTHQCRYLGWHLSVPPRLAGCIHIVSEELRHPAATLLPLFHHPYFNPSVHPTIQTSTQACPGWHCPQMGEAMRDGGRGDAMWDWDGGVKKGGKDTRVVLLHSNVALVILAWVCSNAHNVCNYRQGNRRRELLKGSSSLTQQFLFCMDKILNSECLLVELK